MVRMSQGATDLMLAPSDITSLTAFCTNVQVLGYGAASSALPHNFEAF